VKGKDEVVGGCNDTGLVVVREYFNVPFPDSSPLLFEERKDCEITHDCDAERGRAVADINGVRPRQLKEVGNNFRRVALEVDCVNPELGAITGGETPVFAYLRECEGGCA
jgi:hypothetical protein